ncbi:MAG: aspartate/glutamate racemase family protein [Pseudomonadota bacterium]
MRILIANPNTSASMTEQMVDVAARVAAPDTEIVSCTATRGFEYISSRSEAQIAGAVVLEAIVEHAERVDAVVIGAYGDPGLVAAKELFDIPIVGMAEAAMLTACMVAERFSLVTFSANLVPWFIESVNRAGLDPRCASVRTPSAPMGSVHAVQDALRDVLVAEVDAAVEVDGADAVILAGAPLAGLAFDLPNAPGVLIDPISSALKQAETLVRVAPRGAATGRFARPPGKLSAGLDPKLGDWMARR